MFQGRQDIGYQVRRHWALAFGREDCRHQPVEGAARKKIAFVTAFLLLGLGQHCV